MTAGGLVASPPIFAQGEKVNSFEVIGLDSAYQTEWVTESIPNKRQEPAALMTG